MPQAVFWVSVNGQEITSSLAPILISMEINDGEGGESDSLDLELDDAGGMIELPPTNASIEAGIMYEDDNGFALGPPVQFSGKVDKPESTFGRGQGLTLRISAKSADQKGKPKEHQEKHHDKGKLSEVAKKWGKDAGLDVAVAGNIDTDRDYWAMQGESFLNWGARIARELDATFKVRNGQAVFAERGAGMSAGGKSLPTIRAALGENIISGTMSPVDDRQEWKKFRVRYYDNKKAKYVYKDAESQSKDGEVVHLNRYTHSDEGTAKARGKSNSKQADSDKGGGTITIDGEPSAQAECMCIVAQVRPGIDGTYRVKSAKHKLSRSSGYTTELELKQPGGDAGKDSRGSKGASK